MPRFTLVLKPNGKALLVTPDTLDPEHVEHLRRLWDEWRDGHKDVLFVSGTDVKLVEDIELQLPEEANGREERQGSRRQGRDDGPVDRQRRRQPGRS